MRAVLLASAVCQASAGNCCWSSWGDASQCGNYPGGTSGALCGNDASKSCSSDNDCPDVPAPPPPPPDAPKAGGVLGAYFANWAQYHQAPYTHKAEHLAPIAPRLDNTYFGFAYFCPPAGTPWSEIPYWAQSPYGSCRDDTEYEIMTVEANDEDSIATLVAQGPKLIYSIGGWNFPSAYFSKMVSSSESRAKFINSAKSFITSHGMGGIDIDWEFPCSEPRTNPVKITCDKFRTVEDKGGKCPDDADNLVTFLKELREGLGDDMHISVASQAGEKNWKNMNLKEASQYVTHWNVMNYDYVVSDVEGGQTMSPNAPLYTPSAAGTAQMSIDYTMQGYLAEGVPPEKIMVGIPFYGHTWFAPGMSSWQSWGGQGSIQGECCGVFAQTYGAKPGKACSQCGVMMYSEILAAGCDTTFDDETKSDIMYCSSAGNDGYTEAGTWATYNGLESIEGITQYAIDNGFAGVFAFDSSMDTLADGSNGGGFSFKLMNAMADKLENASPSPPGPAPGPPGPAPGPSGSSYKCIASQCVPGDGGVSHDICSQLCTPSTYKCIDNQCQPASGGVDANICGMICGGSVV